MTPAPLHIRSVIPRDAASVADCVDLVARERRWLAAVEGFGLRATDDFIRANLAVGNPHVVAVTPNGIIAGWCDIVPPMPWPGFDHVGRLGMGLLPRWRGQGWGTRLIETALGACRPRGFTRIELDVYAHNSAAIALYRKLGFQQEGLKRGVRILDGETHDMVLMARFLS
jgi:ribosomal protein S18 acetylase RimI-like enzyme